MNNHIRHSRTTPGLLNRIDAKLSALRRNPDYVLAREKVVESGLNTLSNAFCWWIHNPDLGETILEENGGGNQRPSQAIRGLSKEARVRIKDAWFYFRGYTLNAAQPVDKYLSRAVLRHVGSLLDPANTDFRRSDQEARIFYPDYTAPSGFQVQDEIDQLTAEIRESSDHPVNKAIYAHLGIVSIQPFVQGNKRLAKLVQQSMLYDRGLPPALITPNERHEYVERLRASLVEGTSEAQQQFYNFMATRILYALTSIQKNVASVGKTSELVNAL